MGKFYILNSLSFIGIICFMFYMSNSEYNFSEKITYILIGILIVNLSLHDYLRGNDY